MARHGKGEGSISRRKDGRWEGAITIGYTDKGNPKRIRKYGKTRKEVAEQLAKLQAEHLKGTLSVPDKTTVAEWLRHWLESKEAAIRDKTVDIYRNQIEHHIIPVIGSVPIQQLRPAQVRELYASWGKKGLASSTQRATANRLKAALREAQQLEIIARNPAEAVRLQVAPLEKCAKAWEREEVRRFLETAKDDPLYPAFFLMLTLGLRRGEALGLRWVDFDPKRRVLRIEQALTVTRNKASIAKLKTKAS